jgi:hypothetical protein
LRQKLLCLYLGILLIQVFSAALLRGLAVVRRPRYHPEPKTNEAAQER